MGKDPAALLYIDKWIAATQGMKGNAKGWFLDLILHQYDKGNLPADIDELASICRIRPSEYTEFEQVFKQVLEQKFKQNEEGRLENPFAKEIIQRRQAFKDKRSNSGKWGYAKKFIIKNYGNKSEDELTFIYQHFDFNVDLKNEQVLKQMLEQIFKLYINVNENVIEDEDYKYEYKESVPRESGELVENIISYFGASSDVMGPAYSRVVSFVEKFQYCGQLEKIKTAFEKYKEYKARSEERIHGIEKWMGTPENYYQDGVWAMNNWEQKLLNLPGKKVRATKDEVTEWQQE